MKSKITGGETEVAFTSLILNTYQVSYYRCLETGFIQTEEPYWLDEAYSSAITKLDIGLVERNEQLRNKAMEIISSAFDPDQRFLDYAGGYGMFTRMMRDKGYDFYHHDVYCQNLFAEHFDLINCEQKTGFGLVTAFEVFEHLVNPIEDIRQICQLSDNLLFSTVLQPKDDSDLAEWWYIAPETGQHIAFYTEKSLRYIADQLGLHFLSDGFGTHLFTKEELRVNPFEAKKDPYLIRSMRRKLARFDNNKAGAVRQSLLQSDFDYIRSKIRSQG
jgi:hypothetical protein